ncbi:hypothetical protein TURU_109742 [Turdus rufiventris]|nr:hypothetical protein TURU_109742 [Turdus rufiventris]
MKAKMRTLFSSSPDLDVILSSAPTYATKPTLSVAAENVMRGWECNETALSHWRGCLCMNPAHAHPVVFYKEQGEEEVHGIVSIPISCGFLEVLRLKYKAELAGLTRNYRN